VTAEFGIATLVRRYRRTRQGRRTAATGSRLG
jgi:hypothetical protein